MPDRDGRINYHDFVTLSQGFTNLMGADNNDEQHLEKQKIREFRNKFSQMSIEELNNVDLMGLGNDAFVAQKAIAEVASQRRKTGEDQKALMANRIQMGKLGWEDFDSKKNAVATALKAGDREAALKLTVDLVNSTNDARHAEKTPDGGINVYTINETERPPGQNYTPDELMQYFDGIGKKQFATHFWASVEETLDRNEKYALQGGIKFRKGDQTVRAVPYSDPFSSRVTYTFFQNGAVMADPETKRPLTGITAEQVSGMGYSKAEKPKQINKSSIVSQDGRQGALMMHGDKMQFHEIPGGVDQPEEWGSPTSGIINGQPAMFQVNKRTGETRPVQRVQPKSEKAWVHNPSEGVKMQVDSSTELDLLKTGQWKKGQPYFDPGAADARAVRFQEAVSIRQDKAALKRELSKIRGLPNLKVYEQEKSRLPLLEDELKGLEEREQELLRSGNPRNQGGNEAQPTGRGVVDRGILSQMPDPRKSDGRIIRDTETGDRYYSDGEEWIFLDNNNNRR